MIINQFVKCYLILFFGLTVNGARRIHMSDLKVITLRDGYQTTGRRGTVPQLECFSGPCHKRPSVVQCYNKGTDGDDIQWKCEFDGEEGVNFDQSSLDVICEGYDYPDDEYLTIGSCGLEYRLVPLPKHRPEHRPKRGPEYKPNHRPEYKPHGTTTSSVGYHIIGLIFICVIVWIFIISICGTEYPNNRPSNGPSQPPRPRKQSQPVQSAQPTQPTIPVATVAPFTSTTPPIQNVSYETPTPQYSRPFETKSSSGTDWASMAKGGLAGYALSSLLSSKSNSNRRRNSSGNSGWGSGGNSSWGSSSRSSRSSSRGGNSSRGGSSIGSSKSKSSGYASTRRR